VPSCKGTKKRQQRPYNNHYVVIPNLFEWHERYATCYNLSFFFFCIDKLERYTTVNLVLIDWESIKPWETQKKIGYLTETSTRLCPTYFTLPNILPDRKNKDFLCLLYGSHINLCTWIPLIVSAKFLNYHPNRPWRPLLEEHHRNGHKLDLHKIIDNFLIMLSI
jgi:hypothetical protein